MVAPGVASIQGKQKGSSAQAREAGSGPGCVLTQSRSCAGPKPPGAGWDWTPGPARLAAFGKAQPGLCGWARGLDLASSNSSDPYMTSDPSFSLALVPPFTQRA